jgi:hypothetical protein
MVAVDSVVRVVDPVGACIGARGSRILLVVNDLKDWPLEMPGVEVVTARTYLTDPRHFDNRAAKVFNLCRSYRYQSAGYYVSLLAAARQPDMAMMASAPSMPS